jgi:hypothetical protein
VPEITEGNEPYLLDLVQFIQSFFCHTGCNLVGGDVNAAAGEKRVPRGEDATRANGIPSR